MSVSFFLISLLLSCLTLYFHSLSIHVHIILSDRISTLLNNYRIRSLSLSTPTKEKDKNKNSSPLLPLSVQVTASVRISAVKEMEVRKAVSTILLFFSFFCRRCRHSISHKFPHTIFFLSSITHFPPHLILALSRLRRIAQG